MARRTIFLGSPLASVVDTRGPARPSWPDVGSDGVQLDAGAAAQLRDAVAIALAAETDWDLVRVWFAGIDQPELLLPGRVLFIPTGARVSRLEALFPSPSTRLYPATGIAKGVTSPTSLPPGVAIAAATPGANNTQFVNNGAAALPVLVWSGAAGWTPASASPWASGTNLQTNASIWPALDGGITGGTVAPRPADVSFDGGAFSLADYIEAGLVPGANLGVAAVSGYFTDSHGNPGDIGATTLLRYARYFQGAKLSAYGKLSQYFFARLALDVFDRFPVAELGGHPYRPRLAPTRFITLPQIAVAATTGAPANPPDQALLTFPVVNADYVELLLLNSGAQDLYIRLVEPAATDRIDGVAGVPDVNPAPAAQWETIAAGAEGAVALDQPTHPYCKIVVGANAGGTTIAAGALLAIKRRVIE